VWLWISFSAVVRDLGGEAYWAVLSSRVLKVEPD